jgi:5-methyltetrahydrofolate--homocysteine methyltransferase
MNELMDPATRQRVLSEHVNSGNGASVTTTVKLAVKPPIKRSPKVRTDLPIPPVEYLDRKLRLVPDLRELWSYVNPYMLFGRHLGYRGDFEKNLAAHEAKAVELYNEAATFMKVRAVWQFFEAESEGDALHLFAPGGLTPLHTWHFKRQKSGDQLCLTDYVLPPRGGKRDHLAIFVVTAGEGVHERSEQAKQQGYYFKSHALQALALETAEGCAEWLHRRIREDWGFPDPPELTMPQRFVSRYRGKRYSFGYPACPDLEDQASIWKLLRPDDIGVQLTEGFMMDPEASVSALVFHHPDCTYFSIGEDSQAT